MIDKKRAYDMFYVQKHMTKIMRSGEKLGHVTISEDGREKFNKIQNELYDIIGVYIHPANVIDYLLSIHDRYIKNLEG